jgi:S-adenosylmethionine:tRNA ribosyltransferase-isomerase
VNWCGKAVDIEKQQNRRQFAVHAMQLTHPKNISIGDYQYDLPSGSIAHYPLAERDASKLLIYRDGEIGEDIYRHIAAYLPERSLLVFNNTKVVEARIVFQKATGAEIEIFCLEPAPEYADISSAMMRTGKVRWKCLIGGASKWKAGQVLSKTIPGSFAKTEEEIVTKTGEGHSEGIDKIDSPAQDADIILEARYISKLEGAFLLELSWTPVEMSFAGLLHRAGQVPLPPYLRRAPDPSDSQRYQTIYARHDGSVAAPTAGLHFTEAIFESLAVRDIRQAFVTLHVGAGTFLPVKAETMEQHTMHIEYIDVTKETIRDLLDAFIGARPIIAVGTTSARTIESLYWLGMATIRDPLIAAGDLVVRQWDAYEQGRAADAGERRAEEQDRRGACSSPEQALQALLDWMEGQALDRLVTTTQLLIMPGYDWKIAGALITNFHQPGSTLLLLVASLIGKDWKKVYDHALEHGFRFLSYGDGCLLFPGRDRQADLRARGI